MQRIHQFFDLVNPYISQLTLYLSGVLAGMKLHQRKTEQQTSDAEPTDATPRKGNPQRPKRRAK